MKALKTLSNLLYCWLKPKNERKKCYPPPRTIKDFWRFSFDLFFFTIYMGIFYHKNKNHFYRSKPCFFWLKKITSNYTPKKTCLLSFSVNLNYVQYVIWKPLRVFIGLLCHKQLGIPKLWFAKSWTSLLQEQQNCVLQNSTQKFEVARLIFPKGIV